MNPNCQQASQPLRTVSVIALVLILQCATSFSESPVAGIASRKTSVSIVGDEFHLNGKPNYTERSLDCTYHERRCGRSAGLQTCCIAGFQPAGVLDASNTLPTGKSAIQQIENLRYARRRHVQMEFAARGQSG